MKNKIPYRRNISKIQQKYNFQWGTCYSIFCFLCSILSTFVFLNFVLIFHLAIPLHVILRITNSNYPFGISYFFLHNALPHPRGCTGGIISTMFLHPRGTSSLKGVNPAETAGYRNGTERFFSLKGRPSVVRNV